MIHLLFNINKALGTSLWLARLLAVSIAAF